MIDWIKYDYSLPPSLIAQTPAVPRDHSRLFVYDTSTDSIQFNRFYNLPFYLSSDCFLVLNNTKVLPARVVMRKETGGRVVVLFLLNEIIDFKNFSRIRGLVDRQINLFEKLFFDGYFFITAIEQNEKIFTFHFNFPSKNFFVLLQKYGQTPIPLYLRKTPLKENQLLKRYQTIFAKKKGSVAAPTAGLHFTNRVFKKLEKRGISRYFITLHVGLGTFMPINEENLKTGKLHEEYYELDKKTWKKIQEEKNSGKKLLAVGTTVVRVLESISKIKNQNEKLFNKTDLFIFPPFNFRMVDILLTNLHLPKSSLLMLVEAFLQYKKAKRSLVELYNIAIKNNFRFYSFGDAMLIV